MVPIHKHKTGFQLADAMKQNGKNMSFIKVIL